MRVVDWIILGIIILGIIGLGYAACNSIEVVKDPVEQVINDGKSSGQDLVKETKNGLESTSASLSDKGAIDTIKEEAEEVSEETGDIGAAVTAEEEIEAVDSAIRANKKKVYTSEEDELDDLFDERDPEDEKIIRSKKKEQENQTSSQANAEDTKKDRSASKGDYTIVAGTYSTANNAEKTASKLIDLGYKAEVKQFTGSSYHSVLVGNYVTRADARVVVSELKKKHDHRAYVHLKRK